MNFYKTFFRPILFRFDPEVIHRFVFSGLKLFFLIPGVRLLFQYFYNKPDKRLKRKIFGIDFQNPVGLAAGLDKNAELFDELAAFGFGFIEIGTVTPLPQPGNDKPRMFRLPKDEALINRMGFNNDGVSAVAVRLRNRKSNVIIGGNIGKNKLTPNDDSVRDYENCFRNLYSVVDYFAINVSSPNTPGLRSLQEKQPLLNLLSRLQIINRELSVFNRIPRRPILLKIAPDLSDAQLDEIVEVVLITGIDGVIATNTTLSRENLHSEKVIIDNAGAGGLSGKPLSQKSTEVIRYLAEKSQKRFAIIGVGGIHSVNDAIEKLKAGADLIQLYTGFIYEGPKLVKDINRAISDFG